MDKKLFFKNKNDAINCYRYLLFYHKTNVATKYFNNHLKCFVVEWHTKGGMEI